MMRIKSESYDKEPKTIHLKPGDIIIEGDSKIMLHIWIHGNKESEVIHATTGKKVKGVTRHTIKRYLTSNGGEINNITMLRFYNEQLRKLITLIAENFAPLFTTTQLKSILNLNIQSGNLKGIIPYRESKIPFTPYSPYRENRENSHKEVKIFNTFRAIRTALRSGLTTNKVMPLSKKKGVCCNEFVNYCIQSALVILLLGTTINELQPLVNQISEKRRIKKNIIDKYTATTLLKNLYKKFILLSNENNQLPEKINKQTVLDIIGSTVKGATISQNITFWSKSFPLFEDVKGNLISKSQLLSLDDLSLVMKKSSSTSLSRSKSFS